jgi:hypothetical protein
MTGRERHRCQFTPVPRDSVEVGKDLLDDPGHRGGYRVVRDSRRPIGGETLVMRVGTAPPVTGSMNVHPYLSIARAIAFLELFCDEGHHQRCRIAGSESYVHVGVHGASALEFGRSRRVKLVPRSRLVSPFRPPLLLHRRLLTRPYPSSGGDATSARGRWPGAGVAMLADPVPDHTPEANN